MALITKRRFGFQSKKKYYWYIRKKFNQIVVKDMAYCSSHNFLYDPEIETEKLYNAMPCFYTDTRYEAAKGNYFRQTVLYFKRGRGRHLRYLKNITSKVNNVPKDKCFVFESSYYFGGVDFSYRFKGGKLKYNPAYKIDLPAYFENFREDAWAQQLTMRLRAAGFIVGVYPNTGFLLGLLDATTALIGKQAPVREQPTSQIAIAYGHGKIVGFSAGKEAFRGYGSGQMNILWDKFKQFDKWSRAERIAKTTPLSEIIDILKCGN